MARDIPVGNGSLLVHTGAWGPAYLEGVDLGESILSARKNMELARARNWNIVKADLTRYGSPGFDVVYCIGVLHHLKDPKKGFDAVVRNTKSGGRFPAGTNCHGPAWSELDLNQRPEIST